jgi:hypothetical protein
MLLPLAPADIKDDLSTVLKAAADAGRQLGPKDVIADAVRPLYRRETVAAKAELERYASSGPCG